MPAKQSAVSVAMAAGVIACAIVTDVLLGACALGDTSPSPPPPQQDTVFISANGLQPGTFIGPPAIVRFVNRDNEPHDLRSDPHPGHTDCTELNLGRVEPGQSVSLLTPLSSGRSCGYHDDTRPDDVRFQGRITAQ
jgi:hypothetical protein